MLSLKALAAILQVADRGASCQPESVRSVRPDLMIPSLHGEIHPVRKLVDYHW